MVYPTLIAAVSDASHPSWRARSLSVYRFWRDLGYAIGAALGGRSRGPVRHPCRDRRGRRADACFWNRGRGRDDRGTVSMNLYERFVLPELIDLAMRQPPILKYRRAVVPAARGRVLEIGVGSGRNLPLYQAGVSEVIGIDPSDRLLELARVHAAGAAVPISSVARLGDRARRRRCQHRHCGHDLDALFHFRSAGRADRDAAGAQARWVSAIRRAWSVKRCRRGALAASAHAGVAPPDRRLSSRPQNRRSCARCGLRASRAQKRVRPGTTPYVLTTKAALFVLCEIFSQVRSRRRRRCGRAQRSCDRPVVGRALRAIPLGGIQSDAQVV